MSDDGQRITRELELGEVVSKTFELFRREFVKYVVLFLVVQAIEGVLDVLVRRTVSVPAVPSGASSAQVVSSSVGILGAEFSLIVLIGLVTLIFYPVVYGGAVKMAADEIQNGRADLGASVRFAISKLVSLWVVGIVVGIIVLLGFVALIVPGIILSIMFSLVIPVIMVENSGALASLGRSRELVGHRWLKTLGLLIVFGIMIGIITIVVSLATTPLGDAGTVLADTISALYAPLIPIFLAVYYYSNVARIAPPMPPTPPPSMFQASTRFCPACGARVDQAATFCPNCGTKLS